MTASPHYASLSYLSLFTGGMGGDLAMQHLLGFKCKGYVEIDEYCQKLIRQRQEDGLIDKAPIFTDIRTFISDGYAASYKGMVDLITGGFPCQPFSVAGKQLGADDPRNMWPATIESIRIIQPQYAFLENVPGLLVSGYFHRILGDLAESGLDARWKVVSAAEVGAPHKRDRVWLLAYSINGRSQDRRADCSIKNVHSGYENNGPEIAKFCSDASDSRLFGQEIIQKQAAGTEQLYKDVPLAIHKGLQITEQDQFGAEGFTTERCDWWATEPDVGRVANGVASRVDRLKALGNGQVPIVAATAFRILSGGMI